jgi:hypothetical protein
VSAPLVVNTLDGTVWVRRGVTRDGLALYALSDACRCPEFVMATLAELAEHGIAGSADALPMLAGSSPSKEQLQARIADLEQQLAALTAQGQVLRQTRQASAERREVGDGEHYATVHHTYLTPRDLPPIGGAL